VQLQRKDKLGEGGTDRPENLLTIFVDLKNAAQQRSQAKTRKAEQLLAAKKAADDRCATLRIALEEDAGLCGRSSAADNHEFCSVRENPTCREEILRSVAIAHEN
jgi:hypothetical protein